MAEVNDVHSGEISRRPTVPSRVGRLGSIAAAWAVSVAIVGAQSASPASAGRDPAQRAAERIKALQREAESLATQETALLVQLRQFEIQRQMKAEELAQIARDRAQAEAEIADADARAERLRQRADREQPEIAARLVRVYKLGRPGFWRLLFDVDNLRSVGRAYRTAAALTRIDRNRVLDHQRTLEALAREQRALRERAAGIADLETRARAARAAMDEAVAARTTLIASIDHRRDLNARMTGELQAAQQRLRTSVDRLASGTPAPAVLPIGPFRGALPWPAHGSVTGRFSPRTGGGQGGRSGVELSLPEGEAVRAVHDGIVAFAGPFTGYGNLVIVQHGEETYSLYGYLSALDVSRGDHVAAQAPVGVSGLSPAGNPSLYFELRVDGGPVDPLQWLIRE
jgi:septal ring factor EnvC (AmiA/AmiB activator)